MTKHWVANLFVFLSATVLIHPGSHAMRSPSNRPLLLSESGQVRAAQLTRISAIEKADVETLRTILSPTYYHVDLNGRVLTKAEFIGALLNAGVKFYRIDSEEIEAGLNIAIATGVCTLEGPALKAGRLTARFSEVWRLTDGRWVNSSFQATEVRSLNSIR